MGSGISVSSVLDPTLSQLSCNPDLKSHSKFPFKRKEEIITDVEVHDIPGTSDFTTNFTSSFKSGMLL